MDLATEILHVLLRYYVQGNPRMTELKVRGVLADTPDGDSTMQTFLDRYMEQAHQQGVVIGNEQGRQQGQAAVLLHLIARKFGPPSESVRERVVQADPETLFEWSERILTADSLEAVLG